MLLELAATQGAILSFVTGAVEAAPHDLVIGDDRASAGERLRVYAFMYRARLVEALEATYPRLARHLGQEPFKAIALGYVGAHPSRHPSLRFLGDRLPAWLERHRPDAPWLADLARLEWARDDVFDAPDQPLLTMAALRDLDPEAFATLPVKLVAAHRLIVVHPAAANLWDTIGAGESDDRDDPPAQSEKETLVVWRQETMVYHRAIGDDEAAALAHAAGGTTFGAICEALGATLPPEEAAPQVFAWLSMWTTDGLLAL